MPVLQDKNYDILTVYYAIPTENGRRCMCKLSKTSINILTACIVAVIIVSLQGCGISPPVHKPVPIDMDKLSQHVTPLTSDFSFILKTGHKTKIKSLAVSPDGRYLLSGDISGFVKLWDLKKRDLIKDLDNDMDVVYSVDFSPDGKKAMAGYFDDTIKIWSVPDGKLLIEKSNLGEQAAFSPDGKTVACAGIYRPLTILNAETLTPIKAMGRGKTVINTIAFSHDGKFLATGEGSGAVRIWKVKTGKVFHSLKGHKWWVHSVKFSRDDKKLVSGSYTMKGSVKWQTIRDLDEEDKEEAEDDYFKQEWAYDDTVIVWDVRSGKMIHKFDHPFGSLCVDFSPDGKEIASSGLDNTVRLWNIASGKEIFNLLIKEAYFINNVAFTPDGKNLISGGGDNQVKIIDAATGKIQHIFKQVESAVEDVSVSPDGNKIAASRRDGNIDLWDLHSHTLLYRINTGDKPVQAISFSPDGKYIASGDNLGFLRLWNADTGEKISERDTRSPIISLDFSPDGKYIITGDTQDFASLRGSPSLNPVWSVTHGQSVISTVFSPDGKYTLSCDFGRGADAIRLTDVKTGSVIKNFSSEGNPAWSVVFFPKTDKFAVTRGRKIVIIDSRAGKTVQELKDHKAPVWTLAVDPSGTYMASGAMDGEIILWNISGDTVKLIGRQPAHDSEVETLTFSPEEQVFVSGSKDSTVKIWSVDDFQTPDYKTGAIIKPGAVLQGLSENEWISVSDTGEFKASKDAYRFVEGVILKGKSILKQGEKIILQ